MSSDNAQSVVTYKSISSDSDGPSWRIPCMNAEPEHPEYHAPSDDDIQVEDDDEDLEEDPNEEREPEDENTREPSEGSDKTEPFVKDETAVTPPPPRHRGARISVRPQTPMGLVRSPSHDARTIARAADRVEDVGYVRALQASERRMMTSIEEVNLRVSY
nr:hypothetical protein [Tanacetum cinerariifolium]